VTPPPFQTLVDTHAAAVYRFLVAQVGPGDADDCWQETFLAALRAYPRLRDDNLRSWLFTIAHNKAMDSHRGRGRRPTPLAQVPDRATDRHEGPDSHVWELVRALPEKQRASVVLRYANDLPYAEIARISGTSEAAARQNVRQGLQRLRREMSDE
jgi:RNA polymerase sigma factor (sigma-70 family)